MSSGNSQTSQDSSKSNNNSESETTQTFELNPPNRDSTDLDATDSIEATPQQRKNRAGNKPYRFVQTLSTMEEAEKLLKGKNSNNI